MTDQDVKPNPIDDKAIEKAREEQLAFRERAAKGSRWKNAETKVVTPEEK